MKRTLLVYGLCLAAVSFGPLSSAYILNEKAAELPVYQQREGGQDNHYSFKEVVSVLSSVFFGLEQTEVETAVGKMDLALRDVLVDYVIGLLNSDDKVSEAVPLILVVECQSQDKKNDLMRGVGRLILWELRNGIKGIRSYHNEDLPEDSVELQITGLRGVFDIIDTLNSPATEYARLY